VARRCRLCWCIQILLPDLHRRIKASRERLRRLAEQNVLPRVHAHQRIRTRESQGRCFLSKQAILIQARDEIEIVTRQAVVMRLKFYQFAIAYAGQPLLVTTQTVPWASSATDVRVELDEAARLQANSAKLSVRKETQGAIFTLSQKPPPSPRFTTGKLRYIHHRLPVETPTVPRRTRDPTTPNATLLVTRDGQTGLLDSPWSIV